MLDRVADPDPAALGSGDRAAHQNQSFFGIGRDDSEVLLGGAAVAHVAGHFLALEDLTRVLAVAGRAVGAMGYRNAVAGAQTAEIVPLHGAGESLADGNPCHIHVLARHEMFGRQLLADLEQGVRRDPEFY